MFKARSSSEALELKDAPSDRLTAAAGRVTTAPCRTDDHHTRAAPAAAAAAAGLAIGGMMEIGLQQSASEDFSVMSCSLSHRPLSSDFEISMVLYPHHMMTALSLDGRRYSGWATTPRAPSIMRP